MADIKTKNPHQEEIDKLATRILPRVRAMPFAINHREPWLGNAAVDKAVIATIETCFALADEDRAKIHEVAPHESQVLDSITEPTTIHEIAAHESQVLNTTSEPVIEKQEPVITEKPQT